MMLREAAERGIRRLRLPHWADPGDYLEIDLVLGGHGPWGHLYAPSQALIGEPTPQSFLMIPSHDWREVDNWEPYDGPLLPRRSRQPAVDGAVSAAAVRGPGDDPS